MNVINNKTKISTIVLILLLTLSAILIALPSAAAQTTTQVTYPFVGVVPNPAGINQIVLFHVGIFQQHGLRLVELPVGVEGAGIGSTAVPNRGSTSPRIPPATAPFAKIRTRAWCLN